MSIAQDLFAVAVISSVSMAVLLLLEAGKLGTWLLLTAISTLGAVLIFMLGIGIATYWRTTHKREW